MTKILLTLLFCVPAHAERMVREGTQSTQTSIFVSSLTAQVTMGGSLVVNSSGTFASSVTASAFFGDGSHLSGVAGTWNGGTVTNPSTFTATVSMSTVIITGVYGLPTRQIFTSGFGVYYSTASTGVTPRQLRVRMVGGGGGGGAGLTNNGVGGSSTTFNSISASSGTGGVAGNSSTFNSPGGTGGANGAGTASLRIGGGAGAYGGINGNTDSSFSGSGGNSVLGGAGGAVNGNAANVAGENATANSGSGGSGGAINGTESGGGGGGAGEYVELIINSPASSYTYTVGSGGAGGSAGTIKGGNGGSGIIIVDEYY